jgi:hypothetical protein
MLLVWAANHAVNRAVFRHAFGMSDRDAGEATAYVHAMVTVAFAATCASQGRALDSVPSTPFEMAVIEHSLGYFLTDTVQLLVRWRPSEWFYVVHHVCSAANLAVVWACEVAAPTLVIVLLIGECTNPLARADSVYVQRHGHSTAARLHPYRRIVRNAFYVFFVLSRTIVLPVFIYHALDTSRAQMPSNLRPIFLASCASVVFGGLVMSAHMSKKLAREVLASLKK